MNSFISVSSAVSYSSSWYSLYYCCLLPAVCLTMTAAAGAAVPFQAAVLGPASRFVQLYQVSRQQPLLQWI